MQMFVAGSGKAEVNMATTALMSLWILGQTNIKSTSNLKSMSISIRDNQSPLGYMGWPGLAWGSTQFGWTKLASLKKILSFSILVLSTFERLVTWLMTCLHRNYWKSSNSKSDLGWRLPATQLHSSEYAKEYYIFAGNHTEKAFQAVTPKCHTGTQVSFWIPFMAQSEVGAWMLKGGSRVRGAEGKNTLSGGRMS